LPPDMGRLLGRAALALGAALLLAFSLAFASRWHAQRLLRQQSETSAPPVVDVTVVHRAASAATLSLPGEAAAWYESTIYARVSGYVARWYANIGDRVAAGQLLASIDTPELDAEYAAAKAKLLVAEAQVRVKSADAEFAASTYARWRDSPRGVVSEQERENKKAGAEAAQAQLDAARAEVRLDAADVQRLAALEGFKRVTAPFAGTIVQRRIDIGNLVTAGSTSSTTPLYRMVQDDPVRVFVEVPQSASADLMRVGAPARISMPSATDPPIPATVTRTSSAIDPRARTFRAELDVPNPGHRLVAGQYVNVAFDLPGHGLVRVPAAALLLHDSGPEVAKVQDGRVHFQPVTIARDDGDTVALGSGVAEGDRLVLNISSRITEGDAVQVSGGAEPALAMKGT
jgi:RND family efflux transporter MFP subunit